MIRRYGEAVDPAQRYTPRPGVYGILLRDNEVLLTHQAAPVPELQLPGGGIDPGEHPLPALHREVLEETGWHIAAPRRLGAFRRFVFMPDYDLWAEKICTIYLARPVRAVCAPLEEAHSAIWCPLTEAATQLANSGDRAFMRAVAHQLSTRA